MLRFRMNLTTAISFAVAYDVERFARCVPFSTRGADPAMSTDRSIKPGPVNDSGKIAIWILAVIGAFLSLYCSNQLVSASENWLLLVLFGVLALMVAGPLDLGLGLSTLFRNNPDRPSFFSRSFYGGFGATLLVIMIWSVIWLCDRYDLYGTKERTVHTVETAHLAQGDPSSHGSERKTPRARIEQYLADPYKMFVVKGSLPLLAILLLCMAFPTHSADTAPDSLASSRARARARSYWASWSVPWPQSRLPQL